MKRTYETPFAEKIEFNYANTVVASTTGGNRGDNGQGVSMTDVGCNGVPGHDNAGGNGNGNGNGNGSGKTRNKGLGC
jgi:hypothetical protein